MLLDQIKQDPLEVRQYLERYVNDGSPSGFTELYRTSKLTDPFNLNPWFHLYKCRAPIESISTYGVFKGIIQECCGDDSILLHPDMTTLKKLQKPDIDIRIEESFRVVPTASSRTVQIFSQRNSDYVKLHYDGVLGRVQRLLPYQKAIAGLEISNELKKAISKDLLPSCIAIFPEIGLRCLTIHDGSGSSEIGMILRENNLIGQRASECKHIWPFFALISRDRLSPLDKPIIIQLIEKTGKDPNKFLMELLISPLLKFYFSMICNLGFQIESNAQNVMVGLDKDFNLIAIILRDLMRCEKDIPIRKSLNLSCRFLSSPYKCINDNDKIYKIRHSFAFDFKFTNYLIIPLVEVVSRYFQLNTKKMLKEIKKRTCPFIESLPKNYFPNDGLWYKHERILLTHERPYVGLPNPLLR